jgi:antitoxin PrlF
MTTTVSSKGQITVPASIRRAIGLGPGTRIELKLGPAGTFVARKATKESHFAKFRGIGAKRGPGSREAMEMLRGRVERGDIDP